MENNDQSSSLSAPSLNENCNWNKVEGKLKKKKNVLGIGISSSKLRIFFKPGTSDSPTGVGGRMFGGSMCSTQNRFLINQPRTTGFHLQLSTGNV